MGLGKIVQVGVRAAKHELGESVVVIGLGLLGQLTVQYARLMGAEKVIAIDLAESRLAMAGRHGATHLLKMGAAEAKEEVYRLTDGRGADTVYDVTGHHAVLPLALPLARRHGQVILLGDAGSPELQTLTSDVITRGVRIVGAHDNFPLSHPHSATRWTNFEMYELIMNFLSRGDLKLDDLITHRYRPEQAPEAYAMLQKEREKAMGVVFEWVK
jgi:threonine dehydrogenase-like Zn-dependent dehydrogenase